MSVSSMTGFCLATQDCPFGAIAIEIKSVNSRFLDIQLRLGEDLRVFEPAFREAIIARVARGKVEIRLSFTPNEAQQQSKMLNQPLLQQLGHFQETVRAQFPESAPLSINDLLRWPGVIEEAAIVNDAFSGQVMQCLASALEGFIASREREGDHLSRVLIEKITAMEAIIERITPIVPQLISQFQQKSVARLEEALGLTHIEQRPTLTREETLDRIRQEVALYGSRIDIAEELARLSGHLSETRLMLTTGGQVGKRLDFMMQELNREANTLGSKSAIKELTDAAMALKLLIEQMREQVQNLE